jgi:hypothetical protein
MQVSQLLVIFLCGGGGSDWLLVGPSNFAFTCGCTMDISNVYPPNVLFRKLFLVLLSV